MRNLLIIAMLLCGAFFAGWFTIERDGDRTRIEINKTEIKDDLSDLHERGKDYLDRRREDAENRDRDRYGDEYESVQYGDERGTQRYEDRQSYQDRNVRYQYGDTGVGGDSRYAPTRSYQDSGARRYGEEPAARDPRYYDRYESVPAEPDYRRTQADRRPF